MRLFSGRSSRVHSDTGPPASLSDCALTVLGQVETVTERDLTAFHLQRRRRGVPTSHDSWHSRFGFCIARGRQPGRSSRPGLGVVVVTLSSDIRENNGA